MEPGLRVAIQKTLDHWERMFEWVKKRRNKDNNVDDKLMKRHLGENWFGDDCDLCNFSRRGRLFVDCRSCALTKKHGPCQPVGRFRKLNAWQDVHKAGTWEEWLEAAPRMINQIKSLLKKPKKSPRRKN